MNTIRTRARYFKEIGLSSSLLVCAFAHKSIDLLFIPHRQHQHRWQNTISETVKYSCHRLSTHVTRLVAGKIRIEWKTHQNMGKESVLKSLFTWIYGQKQIDTWAKLLNSRCTDTLFREVIPHSSNSKRKGIIDSIATGYTWMQQFWTIRSRVAANTIWRGIETRELQVDSISRHFIQKYKVDF